VDVLATGPNILADDFLCLEKGPISDIHIWGSWLHDQVDTNAAFWLAIWSDVPRTNTAYPSHPGTLLWHSWFMPGEYLAHMYHRAIEDFFDPNQPGVFGILGEDTEVWQYDFYPKGAFLQEGTPNTNRIYWLSVSALTSTNTLFGWKTSVEHWQDAAVNGHLENWVPMGDWRAMLHPRYIQRQLDLAFAITTTRTNWPPCPDPKLFVQPPDTSPNGLDVLASYSTILADDFVCTNTGWITNLVVYGSWSNDVDNPVAPILIGVWTDVPRTNALYPSHPGRLVAQRWFGPNDYSFVVALANEGFYDPNRDLVVAPDHQLWRYQFRTTNDFWQLGTPEKPRVYWLSVCMATTNQLFGWKTSPVHVAAPDAAVYGHVDPNWYAVGDWRPLHYPGVANQMDLAFEIRTDTQAPYITSITHWNGSVTMEWTACPGVVYRVQYRRVVEGPGWFNLPGDVMALGPFGSKSDLMTPTNGFYRVMRLP